MQDQERIRRRAHEIWEREGRPEGRDQEHWAQAIQGTEAEGGGVSPAAPDDAPTSTAPDVGATPAEAAAAANVVGASRKT
jgi:hypothetical protein